MTNHFDVLIIGAGVSGIGTACQVTAEFPNKTIAVLERRARLGGTWDLFRYPGIRCDFDMLTFGYKFRPWRELTRAAGSRHSGSAQGRPDAALGAGAEERGEWRHSWGWRGVVARVRRRPRQTGRGGSHGGWVRDRETRDDAGGDAYEQSGGRAARNWGSSWHQRRRLLAIAFRNRTVGHAPELERGAQEGAQAVVPPGVPAHGYYAHGYGWHPWGFGFFFGPFLFILFWFVLLKALFFRAFWWGHGPWRYRDYGYRYGPGPWHRRGYGRMHDDEPPAHL